MKKIIAEWAYESFGNIPKNGDEFTYHDITVKVFQMDHNRIKALNVTKNTNEAQDGGEE